MKHLASLALLGSALIPAAAEMVRPPSVPLVACDPYFSIWSPHDRLHDGDTTHWTGKPHRLSCTASIDGKTYRLLGGGDGAVLEQTGLEVLPTRTLATFEGDGVKLGLTFMTPALPDDMALLSRPVTYVTFDAMSADGKDHEVSFNFRASGELTTNFPNEPAEVSAVEGVEGLDVLKAGSTGQRVLARSGDDIRIDWGYLYLAAPEGQASAATEGEGPGPSGDRALTMRFDLGEVGAEPASRWCVLAYDDLYSIQFMRNNLRPFWRRDGWEAEDLLEASAKEYPELRKRCMAFDKELVADLTEAGGEDFAYICALAYRQCFAAGKFVADAEGQPLQFSKENHSNGCIATSDVFYPMAPQFLLFGPTLAKSFIVPFMEYAASERWKFPFAPHDLGQYPHANGQVYGGGETSEENQMPVEECGNLLLLFGAVAQMEGDASFAERYWPQLTRWAEYLEDKGFDPENQLCTDDFAGHLAHNVNLSAKAICALGSYAKLCSLRGDKAASRKYYDLAKGFAQRWIEEADDGDHFRLAFDREGTWSQKYNLVWDRILGLGLFPDDVLAKEMAHYREVQNKYGLPLDNRSDYTKLDWVLWTATLTRERDDFEALVEPVRRFLDETPDRVPMTDWYFTSSAKRRGFTARPVVGGVFLEMLYHDAVWKKYASRDVTKASGWAKLPKPPVITPIVPTARDAEVVWRFTGSQPGDDWVEPGFDDSEWREGKGGFGTRQTPNSEVGTRWQNREIWLRRTFALRDVDPKELRISVHHDEDAEIYLNGVLALSLDGYSTSYYEYAIRPEALATLKRGRNQMAIHCRQTEGGQYIDAGLVTVRPADP